MVAYYPDESGEGNGWYPGKVAAMTLGTCSRILYVVGRRVSGSFLPDVHFSGGKCQTKCFY